MNFREVLIRSDVKSFAPPDIRLLFPEGEPSEFWGRVRTSPAYESLVSEIRSEGGRLLMDPMPDLSYSLFSQFAQDGSRLPYERVYFARRKRLNTLVFLSLLEPERVVWREALCDVLWSICDEYTWCLPAHLKGALETDGEYTAPLSSVEWSRAAKRTEIDLFAAETGFALSEILCLLDAGDSEHEREIEHVCMNEPRHALPLPPLLRSRMKEEVRRRLFKPYLQHGPFHWEKARHNWAAVCAGSIGAAALYLLEDEKELLPVLNKVLYSLNYYLSGFGEDGACPEGIGYWNYGFGYFVYFADLLKKRTHSTIDLFQWAKVHEIALFQQKSYLSGNVTANFSDSLPRVNMHIGLSHYLADRYPDFEVPALKLQATFQEDECSRFAHALRNLIWFDPKRRGESWTSADYYLPNAQWLVSRHVSTAGEYAFAAKGGHNDEPHNHNDLGQFILVSDGEIFAADLGCGEYTADYFGAGRYAYDCNGSQGHSVPIIDGAYQAAGAERKAKVLKISVGDKEDLFDLDLSQAYDLPYLQSLIRRFVWRKPEMPSLYLEDEFHFTKSPDCIVERIVTQCRPHMGNENDNDVVLAGQGKRSVFIHYDGSKVQPIIVQKTYKDHTGLPAAWYAVDFRAEQPGMHVKIAFQFEFQDR